MKKILALVMALTMIFALTAVSASADDAIVLKIGVSTADTDPRNIAANSFAKEIEEKTNGAVKAEVYPAGQAATASWLSLWSLMPVRLISSSPTPPTSARLFPT